MRDVKLGNFPILAQSHTLVLGWNSAAVPLLRQMAIAKSRVPRPNMFEASLMAGSKAGKGSRVKLQPAFDGPVVILADHPKAVRPVEAITSLTTQVQKGLNRMQVPFHYVILLEV